MNPTDALGYLISRTCTKDSLSYESSQILDIPHHVAVRRRSMNFEHSVQRPITATIFPHSNLSTTMHCGTLQQAFDKSNQACPGSICIQGLSIFQMSLNLAVDMYGQGPCHRVWLYKHHMRLPGSQLCLVDSLMYIHKHAVGRPYSFRQSPWQSASVWTSLFLFVYMITYNSIEGHQVISEPKRRVCPCKSNVIHIS